MSKKENKEIGTGLLPLKEDPRDFSHNLVFGAAKLDDLPDKDFFVGHPLEIKDQENTDFCAGFAASAVKEDQENIPLDPYFTWMAAKRLLGADAWKEWGIDLRDICKAACKVGFLERDNYPFDRETLNDRDFLANPANWPADLDMLAWEHAAITYFRADTGPYDIFDNLRSVMWKNRKENRSILTGVGWRHSWTGADKGIIPDEYEKPASGHAIKLFGQMTVNGEIHLVAQLSNGDQIGDKGLFYFPRSVVNREFVYGAFTFKDMPKDYAEYHQSNGFSVDTSTFKKILKVFLKIIIDLFKKI